MNKMNVMELEYTIEYVTKKMKLARAKLETMKNDDTFNDSDLWLLANEIKATLRTEEDNIKEKFSIQ